MILSHKAYCTRVGKNHKLVANHETFLIKSLMMDDLLSVL